jgi:hypothetical protein
MFAKLQHWSLHSRPLGEWQSPEQDGVRVFGYVYGHPLHRDGKEVLTSPVIRCSANRIVTRSGSEYELGAVNPAYERRYPGALDRLLIRLGWTPKGCAPAIAPRRAGCLSKVTRFLSSLGSKQKAA